MVNNIKTTLKTMRGKLIAAFIIFVAIIVFFSLVFYFAIKTDSDIALEKYKRALEAPAGQCQNFLETRAKQEAKLKAEEVADEIASYLAIHSKLTLADLQEDESFKNLAIQIVGVNGYTALIDEKGTTYFHKNPKMEGATIKDIERDFPELWRIVDMALKTDADGSYDWIDPDGTRRKKYAFFKIVPAKTADGVVFRVGSSIYLDEFAAPAVVAGKDIEKEVMQARESLEGVSRLISFFIVVVAILAGALFGIFYIFADRRMSKPLKNMTELAIEISKGKFGEEINITTKDEIGSLAAAINSMSRDLKSLYVEMDKRVKERGAKLEEKIQELQKFKEITVGRELKMIELKKELDKLKGGKK